MIMDNMVYTSKGYISKNRILTNKGWRYLTVPLIKPNGFQTKINELIIENESQANWNIKHLRTIKHHYSKGQGYKQFYPLIEKELMNKSGTYFDLQLRIIKCIVNYLNISTKIQLGSIKNTTGKKENNLILNILKDSNCKKMLLGIGASNQYIDKKIIIDQGFELMKQDFEFPVYKQAQFHGYTKGLSIIDLLLNVSQKEAEFIVKSCGKIQENR